VRIKEASHSPLSNPLRSGEVELVAQSRRQYVVIEIREVQIVGILHQRVSTIAHLVLEVVGIARALLNAGSCCGKIAPPR